MRFNAFVLIKWYVSPFLREEGMREKRRLSTPDDILNAALVKERQSRQFYARLAEQCQIEMVKELLEKLKDEENKHVKMVEKMLRNLRLGRSPL
jgi:rubrerythrin